MAKEDPKPRVATTKAPEEKYRLVYAMGNDESTQSTGLSKTECEAKKREMKAIAEPLGFYNEKAGFGSITCQPESFFAN